MMPPASSAISSYDNPSDHDRQGLALNYDPAATVPGDCITKNKGCMDVYALNYDPWATEPDLCWRPKTGCLDPNAENFGCLVSTKDSLCALPNEQMTPLVLPGGLEVINLHQDALCVYEKHSPPSPPMPGWPISWDVTPEHTVVVKFTTTYPASEEEAQAYLDMMEAKITADLTAAGIIPTSVTATKEDIDRRRLGEGGFIVTVVIVFDDAEAQAVGLTAITDELRDFDEAQLYLMVPLEGPPLVELVTNNLIIPAPSPPPPPDSLGAGAIAGIVVGVIAAIVIVGVGIYCMKKGKGKPVGPAY